VKCLILARGGSKGVPKKNIKILNGKPLIYYVIDAAKKSKKISEIYVSTDDEEISEIVKKYGVKIINSTIAIRKSKNFIVIILLQVETILQHPYMHNYAHLQ
jgi:CMP-N-acetylneuraminic acid synthetase